MNQLLFKSKRNPEPLKTLAQSAENKEEKIKEKGFGGLLIVGMYQ